jgi:hypothetical protein
MNKSGMAGREWRVGNGASENPPVTWSELQSTLAAGSVRYRDWRSMLRGYKGGWRRGRRYFVVETGDL